MFATQKAKDLDMVGMKLVGIYRDHSDPSTNGGYGAGWRKAYEELLKRLHESHPQGSIVVNTKIYTRPGDAHPSYNRTEYIVVGDLYIPESNDGETTKSQSNRSV